MATKEDYFVKLNRILKAYLMPSSKTSDPAVRSLQNHKNVHAHRASNPCNMSLVLAIGVSCVCPHFSAFFILGHSHPCFYTWMNRVTECLYRIVQMTWYGLTAKISFMECSAVMSTIV